MPLESTFDSCRDRRKEWIEAADLLNEGFEQSFVVPQFLLPFWVPVQGVELCPKVGDGVIRRRLEVA